MKKLLFALLVGAALGLAASASTSQPDASTPNCGPKTCTPQQECCVSPHPFTYRCVTPGHCPYNN